MNLPFLFKIGVVQSATFFETNENITGEPRISGVEAELLNILAKTLGFNYQLVIPEDKELGQLSQNGNWTGLIGKVVRGEVDMAFGNIAMTKQRAEVADFSKFYTLEESTFVIGRHRHTERFSLAYLHPFEFSVWVCVLITMAMFTLFLYRFHNNKSTYGQIF